MGHAVWIERVLARTFGQDCVFRDMTKTPPGIDYKQYIAAMLEHCSVVVAIIGRAWVCERLHEPDDMLRHELEVALDRDILIPVLVDDAPLPRAEDLPPGLKRITDRQALWIRNDAYAYGERVLIRRVREMRAQAAPRSPSISESMLSPIGLAMAILTGLSNALLQVGWWKSAGAAALVLATWVAGDQVFARRRSLRSL